MPMHCSRFLITSTEDDLAMYCNHHGYISHLYMNQSEFAPITTVTSFITNIFLQKARSSFAILYDILKQ
jgi:hypothetical protein